MALVTEPAKGMRLRKDRAENVMLCAVSGLNLNRIGFIRCLYMSYRMLQFIKHAKIVKKAESRHKIHFMFAEAHSLLCVSTSSGCAQAQIAKKAESRRPGRY